MGRTGTGWLMGAALSLVAVQACESDSGDAIFAAGAAAGEGAIASGGEATGPDGGEGAKPGGGSATAGSAHAGSDATGGVDGSTGGVTEPGSAGAGAGEGGAPPSSAGQGTGGDVSLAGMPGQTGQGGDGPVCNQLLVAVEARQSNVMFMMDRSGSMFDLNDNPWVAVRDAALPAINAYDGELNLGFMAMTGESGSCPILDEVAPAADNYSAIAQEYGSLVKPTKGESPFMLALTRAADLLDAATGGGDRFAIMVIDGEPDYCNDGSAICGIDSVVARIQGLRARGVTTLIAGLPNITTPTQHQAALQSYANAGLGLAAASVGETVTNIYYQCQGVSGWQAEFTLTGKPALQALGSYSASPGSGAFISLDPTNASGMTAAFNQLFARTKSCTFDIDTFEIDLDEASGGVVKLGDETIPFHPQNGWHMSGSRAVELVGTACSAWRSPTAQQISVSFPCAAVSQ